MNAETLLASKSPEIITTGPHVPLIEAALTLARRRIGALPVVDDCGEVVGLLTERDIVYRYAERGPQALQGDVASVMSRLIAVCGPRDMVSEIARRMTERQMRHMLIMEDGRMLGIVSIGDVVNSRVQAAERESQELKAYIAS